jgi:hypothetical protein
MSLAGTFYELMNLQGGPNGGLLRFVNSTTLSYLPYNGNQLKINGTWRTIPDSGIVGLSNTGVFLNGTAGQNLAASTVYYVYAFMNGAVMTADFSTTGHSTSLAAGNAGIEIKTGDNTRSLIGMVWAGAGAVFADDLKNRLVRSWHNRKAQRRDFDNSFTTTRATASTSWIEINSEIRCYFLNWATEIVTAYFANASYQDALSAQAYQALGWNGVGDGYGYSFMTISAGGYYKDQSLGESRSYSAEGVLNYVTILCACATSSNQYFGSATQPSSITGCIEG